MKNKDISLITDLDNPTEWTQLSSIGCSYKCSGTSIEPLINAFLDQQILSTLPSASAMPTFVNRF